MEAVAQATIVPAHSFPNRLPMRKCRAEVRKNAAATCRRLRPNCIQPRAGSGTQKNAGGCETIHVHVTSFADAAAALYPIGETKRKRFLVRSRKLLIALAALVAVVALGAFVVGFAAKNLVGSGQVATEKSAVASLRALHWAQGIFRRKAHVDEDRNGEGEFGTFRQLAALDPLPSGEKLATPLAQFSPVRADADVFERNGYCFRIDLPESTWERERFFVAWAWPAMEGMATRIYCIDQDEQIWEAKAGPFVGCESGPPPQSCPPDGSYVRWRNKTNVRPVGAH